ncbi:MAG TPA: choice-of-anchor tandem repeat GloVer-containing protein [Rhizomicrobium sp.]|jgi:uncharacterized repeat protein (TIGR03803 family)|nr:choice-of-anchor tandem repeat GloVer-containing protein [Rhizomicrobium sp.]
MSRRSKIAGPCILGCGLALIALAPGANAARFKSLYSFQGGSDGAYPSSALIPDGQGGYYGTTPIGGGTGCGGSGCGTIYDVASGGAVTIAHAFAGGADGSASYASLLPQKDGSYLGTTSADGQYSGGTIFSFAPPSAESVLYSFGRGIRGWESMSTVISDRAGNLYGATELGGAENYGTVFELPADGKYTTLHEFRGTDDGAHPNGPLIRDRGGNLYGTTSDECGVVFKIAPDGTETILHAFQGGNDGCSPEAGLIADAQGNFYGTTESGGSGGCGAGCGTVFKIAPDGTETILYAFQGGNDGLFPQAGLAADNAGNLYGTTIWGSGTGCGDGYGCGTVFKVAPDGTETVLHAFNGSDGYWPEAAPTVDKKGNLYGTTSRGGRGTSCYNSCGTVFVVKE